MKNRVFALTVGLISCAALIPLGAVVAQSQNTGPRAGEQIAQRQYTSLTPEQKSQLKSLREVTKQQVEAVLTPEQRSQFQTEINQGNSPKAAMKSLSLSDSQRQQIQAIRQNAHQQMQAIAPEMGKRKGQYKNLTDAQKSQLQALRQSAKQQVEALLTPEQRSQLQTEINQGNSPKAAMKSLSLSDSQRQQIQAIRQQIKSEKENIISPQ